LTPAGQAAKLICIQTIWGTCVPSYARPTTVTEAVALLAQAPHVLVAGATDLYPAAGLNGDLMDLLGIDGLTGITKSAEGFRIGACTTWTTLAEADLPRAFAALQAASLQVGGRQIQNVGTIGGNLCNASPAADGVPPLLLVHTSVELASPRGSRRMMLAEFLIGPRSTAKSADEILVALHIPAYAVAGASAFVKLGARSHLVISIASVAAKIVTNGGIVTECAIAVGACSGKPHRLGAVEAALLGQPTQGLATRIDPAQVAAALAPISDIRAPADYRHTAAHEMIKRVVVQVTS
jgi:CO/xanthine dehydrogenase FAD-binding subunit